MGFSITNPKPSIGRLSILKEELQDNGSDAMLCSKGEYVSPRVKTANASGIRSFHKFIIKKRKIKKAFLTFININRLIGVLWVNIITKSILIT